MPLPCCTGPYKVGCVDIMTKHLTIPTDFNDPYSICRAELGSFFRLFYPCVKDPCPVKHKQASWLPEPNQKSYARGVVKHVNASPKLFGWCIHLMTKDIKINAHENAPILDQVSWQSTQNVGHLKEMTNLPLVLFSHGLGASRGMYSSFCTQLASEGFIVASVEHRDASATSSFFMSDKETIEIPYYVTITEDDGDEERFKLRNTQVEKRSKEVMAALDILEELNSNPENVHNCMETEFDLSSLKDRIDVTNPLIMGHSFGGATALNTLKKDQRIKCGIALDVWFLPFTEEFFETVGSTKKPVLMINTERFNWEKNLKRCEKYINNVTEDYAEVITLRGTDHVDQCDVPGTALRHINALFKKSSSDQLPFSDGINVQRKIILDYFAKYLEKKEAPVKLLDETYDLPDVFFRGTKLY